MQTDIEKRCDVFRWENLKYLWRAVVVILFCSIGASTAHSPMTGLAIGHFPDTLVPRLGGYAWLLLGAVLIQSRYLSDQGRQSASWATLAFGSLSTCLITMLATVTWYDFDVICERWLGILFLTTLSGLLIYFGLNAALRADWKKMFFWAIPVFFLILFCGVCVNYGQYFYCSRHNLAKEVRNHHPATNASP